MMEEKYREVNMKIQPRPELIRELRAQKAQKKNRFRVWTRVMAAALCLCLVAGGAFALGSLGGRRPQQLAAADLPKDVIFSAAAKDGGFIYPASYEELYDSLMARGGYGYGTPMRGWGFMDFAEAEVALDMDVNAKFSTTDDGMAAAPEPPPMPGGDEGGTDPDYSGTNVQVAGIDEADIVKTDGNYIYVLSQENKKLYIVKADGENSAVVATLKLEVTGDAKDNAWPMEMYLAGDKVFVLFSSHSIRPLPAHLDDKDSRIYPGGYEHYVPKTIVVTVDVSDRAKPKQAAELAQDGSYTNSRMANGYLYIISAQYPPIYSFPVQPRDLEAYCPGVEVDGAYRILPIDDIVICPEAETANYTILTSVSLADGRNFTDTLALSGNSGTVYFDGKNLLLAESSWTSKNSEEKRDSNGRLYTDIFSGSRVNLALLTVDGGKITETASGSIEGNLLNQFSMDIAGDTFRFVVNRNSSSQRIYTEGIDEYGDWTNHQDNCLYVLDAKLNLIGKVEGLGEDEQVKSVRFMGDIAYFVTFRQTDPLFAVDLKDPRNPKVLSALKVPGFSAYLHPYGEGLLFGFGYDADDAGRTGNLKLSMYSIANNADVRELHTSILKKATWSSATWNHKAIFVNAQKNLIAFPAEGSYYVYSYDARTGFAELGIIKLSSDGYWLDDARGMYINDCFYVVTATRIYVLSLDSLVELAVVKL